MANLSSSMHLLQKMSLTNTNVGIADQDIKVG